MDTHYPPPDFETRIYEAQFVRIAEMFGTTLHDIVSAHEDHPEEQIWWALDSAIHWKAAKSKELTKSQRMIAACGAFFLAVNSAGFQKYFQTAAGNAWPYIREILELADDSVALKAFSEVLAVFPDATPSTALARRHHQLDRIAATSGATLDEIFTAHDRVRQPLGYPSSEAVWRALLKRPNERYIPLFREPGRAADCSRAADGASWTRAAPDAAG